MASQVDGGLMVVDKCDYASCGAGNFLPFRCLDCKSHFCEDHHKREAHKCEGYEAANHVIPTCPLCGVLVPVGVTENADAVVNKHISGGCKRPGEAKRRRTDRCAEEGCRRREVAGLVKCPHCKRDFCFSHRMANSTHDCPAERIAKSKALQKNRSTGSRISAAGRAALARLAGRA